MKNIYLVQRGDITMTPDKDVPLRDVLVYDYMGAAEFEGGALGKSLMALYKDLDKYKAIKVPAIVKGESELRLFYNGDWLTEDLEAYILQLTKHYIGGSSAPYSKESLYLSKKDLTDNHTFNKPAFWWDIQNHTFFSFNKLFINRLPRYIKTSANIRLLTA
jgi:hypothetical protein